MKYSLSYIIFSLLFTWQNTLCQPLLTNGSDYTKLLKYDGTIANGEYLLSTGEIDIQRKANEFFD